MTGEKKIVGLWRDSAAKQEADSAAPVEASYLPMFTHLALVLAAGVYLPPPLVRWFQQVAGALG